MRKCFVMAAIVAVVSTGAALGQSTVTYTLGLGGDNQADVYEGGPPPQFPMFDTSGATAYIESDGATFDSVVNPDVTWSVKIGVSGVHEGGLSDGWEPNGLANFVFSLELRDAANELVSTVDFHSTINDGDDDGWRGQNIGPDPLHWAAFTFIYNINDAGVPYAPGRVIDPLEYGGPGLTQYQYPSKYGVEDSVDEPLAEAAPDGTLMGMGAGYPQYVAAELLDSGGYPISDYFFGVGMDELSYWGYDGLGVVPVAEGQMDISALAPGTYTLKLISKKDGENVSNNILEGDFEPDYDVVNAFADLANVVVEDQITFVVAGGIEPEAPEMIAASSVMLHGTAGDFGIDIMQPAPYAVEPREENIVAQHRLVFVFDQTIDISGASVILSSGSVAGLSLATTYVTDDTLVATMATQPTNNACLQINVSGVTDAATGGCTMAPATLYVRMLKGDANASGGVNITDLSYVKGRLFAGVTTANFRADVDASGGINIMDVSATKGNLFGSAVCP